MLELISVPTIMICTAIAMIANTLAMMIVWRNNSKRRAAGYWTISFALGAMSGLLVAANTKYPATIPLAAICITTGYSMYWSGFRAFNNQPALPSVIVGVPALWLVAYFAFPALGSNPNIGIAVQSLIIACFSLASAYTIYCGPGNHRLPMTMPATLFLTAHGLFHLAHIGFVLLDPSTIANGLLVAGWWKAFMLEAFLNVIVSAIASIVLIKERSSEQHRIESQTDPLTGIANRRAFFQEASDALRAAQQNDVLAILDLDNFKMVNDQFGHQAGDHVLMAFTRQITENLPAGGVFGRIGGEEFALYLPDNGYNPQDLLDTLRRKVEQCEIKYGATRIPLTVSIGAAAIEQTGKNLDHLVAAADCALYIAKDEGRNQFVMFSPSQRLTKVREKGAETRFGLAENRVSRRATRSLPDKPEEMSA